MFSLALLPNASTAAGEIDAVFWFVTVVSILFAVGIAIAVIVFATHYRRGNRVDRSRAPQYHMPIEVAWTAIPLVILLAMFGAASIVYFNRTKVPAGAMEIYVVGKQWMWKMQHPEGRWENNELHVPIGRPILLTMTSEDVIHSFFVPAFRLKQDVIPGQYTQMWFTATKPGVYHLFCAEFCGTLHSTMVGSVIAMEPAEYERWLAAGNVPETLAQAGGRLFRQHGCSGCHSPHGSVRAPLLEGIFGDPVPVQMTRPGVPLEDVPATTIIADQSYIHDSIVLPEKHVRAGYRPIMPTYRNRLTEEEILKIVAYIKSLGNAEPGAVTGTQPPSRDLTAEEYRARTGFVPENINRLTGGGGGTAAPAPGGQPGAGRNERTQR